jgi:hypothetical protein
MEQISNYSDILYADSWGKRAYDMLTVGEKGHTIC